MKRFYFGILAFCLVFANSAVAQTTPTIEVNIRRWGATWCPHCPAQKKQVEAFVDILKKAPNYKVAYFDYDIDDPNKPWVTQQQSAWTPSQFPYVVVYIRALNANGTKGAWQKFYEKVGVIPESDLVNLLAKASSR